MLSYSMYSNCKLFSGFHKQQFYENNFLQHIMSFVLRYLFIINNDCYITMLNMYSPVFYVIKIFNQ